MSDYDPRAIDSTTAAWPSVVDGPAPDVRSRSAIDMCGRAAGPIEIAPANQNTQFDDEADIGGGQLFDQLPRVIREAVDEWAAKLMAQPWRFRREIMGHFAKVFADQFEANIPDMTEDAYEGLKEIGFTCLLERLEDGRPIADLDQARVYMDSVHAHHKLAAQQFLGQTTPRALLFN